MEVKLEKKDHIRKEETQNNKQQGLSCKRLCIQSKTNLENVFEVKGFVKPETGVETTTNTAKQDIKS
jgi:hypothetical protein